MENLISGINYKFHIIQWVYIFTEQQIKVTVEIKFNPSLIIIAEALFSHANGAALPNPL